MAKRKSPRRTRLWWRLQHLLHRIAPGSRAFRWAQHRYAVSMIRWLKRAR